MSPSPAAVEAAAGHTALPALIQCLQPHLHDCKVRRQLAWIAKGPLVQAVQLPVHVRGVDKGRPC